MGRLAKPLLTAPSLPALEGGADLVIVETALAHPDPSNDHGYEEERGLCVLVLIDASEEWRRRARAEVALYSNARCSIVALPGQQWGDAGANLLARFEPAFMDVVVALPEYTGMVEQQVSSLFERLTLAGHHVLCTKVAVARQAGVWRGLDAYLGFAEPQSMAAMDGAIWLHAGLAQRAAPELLDCVSDLDLAALWGGSACPARLTLTSSAAIETGSETLDGGAGARATVAVFLLDRVDMSGHAAMARALRRRGFELALIVAAAGLSASRRFGGSGLCVVVESPANSRYYRC